MRPTTLAALTLCAGLAIASSPARAGDPARALENGRGEAQFTRLHTFEPDGGTIHSSVTITLDGLGVTRATAMARHPLTHALYAVLRVENVDETDNVLVTLDPDTGAGTRIGSLGDFFAGIAFLPDATLYGVTGDGASIQHSLFRINASTAQITRVAGLGHGGNGEALATDASGHLIHASGSGDGDQRVERLDLAGLAGITDILLSHSLPLEDEVGALAWSDALGKMFMVQTRELSTIDTSTGQTTSVGHCDFFLKGLAFDGATLYAVSNHEEPNVLATLDPATAATLSVVEVTSPGLGNVTSIQGLARDPQSGALYAILTTDETDGSFARGRLLVTLDPITGEASSIGLLPDRFAGLTFRANGTLLGVTGDGADRAEALFTIDKTTAAATFVRDFGNGADGEAIAVAADGFLYHASGNDFEDQYFERVNLAQAVPAFITDVANPDAVGHTWPAAEEILALAWSDALGAMFMTDRSNTLYRVSGAPAVATPRGFNNFYLKGLAFVGSTLYGLENLRGGGVGNFLHTLDVNTGQSLASVEVTLAGLNLQGMTGLARNPVNGLLYAIVFEFANERRLVTLNPATGVATDIGVLDHRFAGLAFRANGTLIGITGNGDVTDPESLYTINTSTAASTFVLQLGNGEDGEAIAIAADGFLYHASGINVGDQFWERVNLDTHAVTDLGIYSFASAHTFPFGEALSMGYSPAEGAMFLADDSGDLYTINTATGHAEQVGSFSILDGVSDFAMKGLAFGTVAPPCPGDTNGDGVVDFIDLNRVLSAFGFSSGNPNYIPGADLDNDGDVDFIDLNIILSFFGTSC